MLEYVETFERLSFPLKDALEECLMGAFVYRLRTEIQAELEIADGNDLEGLIKLALRVDERNRLLDLDSDTEKGHKTLRTTFNPLAVPLHCCPRSYLANLHMNNDDHGEWAQD